MLNKRSIKSIKRVIFVLISFPVFLFQFLFCYILERKDKKSFKRNIIVLISFLILFVSISYLVNIAEEMSLPGFRRTRQKHSVVYQNVFKNRTATSIYGTREGTCEFYFLTCSDDLICCSNDLISCLHNLSSCSNDIIKLL